MIADVLNAVSQTEPPVAAGILALLGVLVGLWVNGDRTERQRLRDRHARALEAILAYGEMPYMIRRRRCEPGHRSAERVRLSDHFSAVKAEIETCRVLLRADGDARLANAYESLFETARRTVGQAAHEAWEAPPVETDVEMNMGMLFDDLDPFRQELEQFRGELARATMPRRIRCSRAVTRKPL